MPAPVPLPPPEGAGVNEWPMPPEGLMGEFDGGDVDVLDLAEMAERDTLLHVTAADNVGVGQEDSTDGDGWVAAAHPPQAAQGGGGAQQSVAAASSVARTE
eukprot:scaffold207902_cov27-Tisochrysis_lutea.AAC.2